MRIAILAGLLSVLSLYGQTMQQMLIASGGGAAPTSNTVVVHVGTPCVTTSASSINCTVTSTTAGNTLIVPVFGAGANPNSFTCTDNKSGGSSTYTNDIDINPSGQGRVTICSTPNIAAGITSITITKGAAATVFTATGLEVSGLATSSIKDVGVTTANNNSPGTSTAVMSSNVITSTQTDFAFGCFTQRTNATATYAWTGGWTTVANLNLPISGDGDQAQCGYINNAIQGQITANVTTNNLVSNQEGYVVTYKSAVAGSAPSGDSPTIYTNLEGTNTNTVSLATLNATTYGPCTWSVGAGLTGLTYSTGVSMVPHVGVTVNGSTFTTSTTGMAIDMNQATHPAVSCTYNVTSASTASLGFDWRTPTTSDAQQIGMAAFYAQSGDLIGFGQISDNFFVEKFSGADWAGGGWTTTQNTRFRVTCQYKTAGANQSCSMYETSTWSNLGTFTNASVGTTNLPTVMAIGRPGAEGTTSSNTAGIDNIEIDLVNGIFPLLSREQRNYYLDHGILLPGENTYTPLEMARIESGTLPWPTHKLRGEQ